MERRDLFHRQSPYCYMEPPGFILELIEARDTARSKNEIATLARERLARNDSMDIRPWEPDNTRSTS